MAPIIRFVRHAQGFHNIDTPDNANHYLHDPLLTDLGKQQCATLQTAFPYTSTAELVVASPIKRTIYTALYSFDKLIKQRGFTVIALPELQETSDLPCDTGSDLPELQREFAGQPVDLSRVQSGWNSKTGRWAPEDSALQERARVARNWLRARPEREIIVVTHGAVLHYLTEDWSDFLAAKGTGWTNTEFRSYEFKEGMGESASLVETSESRTRRTAKPLSEAEERNLRKTTSDEWQQQALDGAASEQPKAKV